MLNRDDIDRALQLLGDELAKRRVSAELVLLGGASLLARALTARGTIDIDVLGVRLPDGSVHATHPFPPAIREAADVVAGAMGLDLMWLDDRPASDFVNAAPDGYDGRLERAEYGSLTVWHLSRFDICVIKVIAAAERWGERPNKHWDDVRQLGPTIEEMASGRAFAQRIWAPSSAAWTSLTEIEEVLHAGTERQ